MTKLKSDTDLVTTIDPSGIWNLPSFQLVLHMNHIFYPQASDMSLH